MRSQDKLKPLPKEITLPTASPERQRKSTANANEKSVGMLAQIAEIREDVVAPVSPTDVQHTVSGTPDTHVEGPNEQRDPLALLPNVAGCSSECTPSKETLEPVLEQASVKILQPPTRQVNNPRNNTIQLTSAPKKSKKHSEDVRIATEATHAPTPKGALAKVWTQQTEVDKIKSNFGPTREK